MRPISFPPDRGQAILKKDALLRNFRLISDHARSINPNARIIAVVKADAYGHGAGLTVPLLGQAGCDFFAVATLQEALEVRRLDPKADVLILGYTPPNKLPEVFKHRLTQTVLSPEYAAALSAVAAAAECRPSVHLKVDGGLCRIGFSPDDKAGLLRTCRKRHLRVTGLYTHFPCADSDVTATKAALSRFLACKTALNEAGFFPFCHAAASAALLSLPESVLDGPRVGLALYGIKPTATKLPLAPVLSLTAPVVQLRGVPAGTPIGYGGDFVTKRPSRIGTLPLGYADGVFRGLSGLSVTARHRGKTYDVPVVGRISMDQLTVDLTDTPTCVGDTVVLWQNAATPAAHLGTIPYEILTALSPRVRRILK
ncbi:MAG: alanine racemase [Clostridia bacterium]|nr:alanine racemase [Clostridia bacterium]